MGERPAGKGTRTQQHEIVIDAPIEAVWKAISDGEELTRWFVEEASVEPGVGGTISVSWGGDEKAQGRIDAWEPNRKLRKTLMPFEMGAAKYDGTTPMVDEYTIERRDGKTVLRLVSSGIPDAPEWDGFYNGTDSGWASFFRTLRHYLEHHRGRPRTTIKVVGQMAGSPEDAWARLEAAVKPTGTIVFEQAPTILEMNISELGDAYLWHSTSCAGANNYVYTMLSVYGKTPAEVETIRAKWQPWLEQLLGVEAPRLPEGA
jgi:uncharacterized protein YndB with AHSA1/START domain